MYLVTLVGLAASILDAVAVADFLFPEAKDANGNSVPSYWPARPPAIPLAVRSPYLSAWSSTAHNSTLNSGNVIFWTGNDFGWEGMVTVDGISYEYLGIGSQTLQKQPNMKVAAPKAVSYDSQYSNFTFNAGPVEITASFLSPVTPRDICRTSMPLSYLTTSVRSTDNQPHTVQFYSDVNGAWISHEGGRKLQWDLHRGSQVINDTANTTDSGSGVYSWLYGFGRPFLFGERDDLPEWGNISYTTHPMGAQNFTFQSGHSIDIRSQFVDNHVLGNMVDTDNRDAGAREPAFAFAHDFGAVREASVRYTLGSIQEPVMRYLYSAGLPALEPWWKKCYGDLHSMIDFHWKDYATVAQLAAEFEASLKSDVNSYYHDKIAMVDSDSTWKSWFLKHNRTSSRARAQKPDASGELYVFNSSNAYESLDPDNFSSVAIPDLAEVDAYYAIVALSARQTMAAFVYAVPPASTGSRASGSPNEPLVFLKEISSDGNINTVDVLFPATPFLLYANPDILRYSLQPIYDYQEGDFYPNGYCAHDIGSHFPNATGHVEGNDEYMPIEESGNFILMSYAYYKFSGNSAWLKNHYNLLKQFAQYLVEFSLIPAAQLSTDDFAGRLTNQTNLAIKGIIGLQAMAQVAQVAGQPSDAALFSNKATEYYGKWEEYGIDPNRTHALLAYGWRSSWGLLYNTYYDKLLGLGIVNQSVYDMQSKWYPQVSQIFGVPLDSRHHYTKSDWMMWTAAVCSPETRRLFVNGLAYWINQTTTNLPFADLFETIGAGFYPEVPDDIRFRARPVVGGHFAMLALDKSAKGPASQTGPSLPGNATQKGTPSSRTPLPTTANAGHGQPGPGPRTELPLSISTLKMVDGTSTHTATLTLTSTIESMPVSSLDAGGPVSRRGMAG